MKKLILKYDFVWSKDQEKLNTIYFLLSNLIKIIEGSVFTVNLLLKFYKNVLNLKFIMAFLPLCTIFKFYHINAEKSLN